MSDNDSNVTYRRKRKPDTDICESLLSVLKKRQPVKPWELVAEVDDEYDHDEVRFALKTLMLDGTIRINGQGESYLYTDSEQ
jgi:hypothetical protein